MTDGGQGWAARLPPACPAQRGVAPCSQEWTLTGIPRFTGKGRAVAGTPGFAKPFRKQFLTISVHFLSSLLGLLLAWEAGLPLHLLGTLPLKFQMGSSGAGLASPGQPQLRVAAFRAWATLTASVPSTL